MDTTIKMDTLTFLFLIQWTITGPRNEIDKTTFEDE